MIVNQNKSPIRVAYLTDAESREERSGNEASI